MIAHDNNNKREEGADECVRYEFEAPEKVYKAQLRNRFQVGSTIIDFLRSYNFLLHKVTASEIPKGRSLGCPQCGYMMEPDYARLWAESDTDTTSSESDSGSCTSSSSSPAMACKRRRIKRPPAKKMQYSDVLKKNLNSEGTSGQ